MADTASTTTDAEGSVKAKTKPPVKRPQSSASGSTIEDFETEYQQPQAIPLGPDGKPHQRRLSLDGKPIPQKPPKDWKGKPLKPPPIYGPDGKEIPRPVDAHGRPMPVYTTEDGKPILDSQGRAIPLKFDDQGRPKPLELTGTPSSYQIGQKAAPMKESPVPLWLSIGGIANAILCIAIAGYIGYSFHQFKTVMDQAEDAIDEPNNDDDDGRNLNTGTTLSTRKKLLNKIKAIRIDNENGIIAQLVFTLLGGLIGFSNFAKKTSVILGLWIGLTTFILIGQVAAYFAARLNLMDTKWPPGIVACLYFGLLLVFVLLGCCGRLFSSKKEEQVMMQGQPQQQQPQTQVQVIQYQQPQSNYLDTGAIQMYNNQQTQSQQQQILQQQQQQIQQQQQQIQVQQQQQQQLAQQQQATATTMVQPVAMAMPVATVAAVPAMGMGYGGYGYGGYGYGGGMYGHPYGYGGGGNAFATGMALGMGMSPYYDYGWYDPWYW